MLTTILANIFWLGHDGFMIKADDMIVTIDPYQVANVEPADILLITHAHYDHCSPEDVEKPQNQSNLKLPSLCTMIHWWAARWTQKFLPKAWKESVKSN